MCKLNVKKDLFSQLDVGLQDQVRSLINSLPYLQEDINYKSIPLELTTKVLNLCPGRKHSDSLTKYKEHLNIILANFIQSFLFSRAMFVMRDNRVKSEILNALLEKELIVLVKGFYHQNKNGRQSKPGCYYTTRKFQEIVKSFGFINDQFESMEEILFDEQPEFFNILKLIPYNHTSKRRKMTRLCELRRKKKTKNGKKVKGSFVKDSIRFLNLEGQDFLKKYNAFMNEQDIELQLNYEDDQEVINTRKCLNYLSKHYKENLIYRKKGDENVTKIKLVTDTRRVFNDNKFTRGGRFYGNAICRMPGCLRGFIYINGNKITELDFCAAHVRMLYHKIGEYCIDDPYQIEENSRNIFKIISLIVINSTDENQAVRAIIQNNFEKYHTEKNSISPNLEMLKIYKSLMNWEYVKSAIDKFCEKHSRIKQFFFSDIGKKLQFEESQIIEKVLKDGVKAKVPMISIHDSVITVLGNEEFLCKSMMKHYEKATGFDSMVELSRMIK